MLIVDFNQVIISNFMVSIGNHTNIKLEEGLLRHMVLNSLRSYNAKFRAEYGEMVIACDGMQSWRKKVYPYYKANRKKYRDESEIDWPMLFNTLTMLKAELAEYFPYRVIHIDNAEADDIIATLTKRLTEAGDKVLIISGDKDFRQLQRYPNVKQYDPVRKKWLVEPDPIQYLHEHIMIGDRGDGIPNFLSKDDVFVSSGRQKPIREKKFAVWKRSKPDEFCDEEMLRGYKRNQMLVDLTHIPEDITAKINTSFDAQVGKDRSKLFNYFMQNKLMNLLTDIDQF